MLKPPENIQRILISTTSRFYGQFETDKVLIAHAWPGMRDRLGNARMEEGPQSRSAYLLSFETDVPERRPGIIIPQYDGVGDVVCSVLSVLFGKRFDNHGPLQNSGMFGLPDLSVFNEGCWPQLPYHSHKVRSDHPIPLNLTEVHRIFGILSRGPDSGSKHKAFLGAARFYLRALQAADNDPEVAYLHLVTAGEVVSNGEGVFLDDLLDDTMKSSLQRISTEIEGGNGIVRAIRGRLFQIKRRFVSVLRSYVEADFFQRSESEEGWGRLTAQGFEANLKAAYDLRSRNVHTGVSFGHWVGAAGRRPTELQLGRPVVGDPELEDILANAPTFVGLERTVRYVLLNFAARHLGVDVTVPPQPVSQESVLDAPS